MLAAKRKIDLKPHFFSNLLGIVTTRQQARTDVWSQIGITNTIIESCYVSNITKEIGYVFPLYVYPTDRKALFDESNSERQANLSPEFVREITARSNLLSLDKTNYNLGTTVGPEDILGYAYAIFHSPTYRKRYAEFLKIDFPRLPLTSNAELFRALAMVGNQLIKMHLLKENLPDIAVYPAIGDNVVVEVRFHETDRDVGRVWINQQQYFENVPAEVWNFHIGGYQVCHKWLKDRKGRTLNFDDIVHYKKIVSALSETIRIMSEIDEIIEEHGGFPIN